jgi:hypothetical protein
MIKSHIKLTNHDLVPCFFDRLFLVIELDTHGTQLGLGSNTIIIDSFQLNQSN